MLSLLRRISLTQWIIIAMILGAGVGWIFPEISQHIRLISNIFLRMIKSIIVPLLFGTLVIGIAGHSDDLKAVGRLALRSIIYFEIVTTLALFIGLAAVNLTKPGAGVALPASAAPGKEYAAKNTTVEGMIERAEKSLRTGGPEAKRRLEILKECEERLSDAREPASRPDAGCW